MKHAGTLALALSTIMVLAQGCDNYSESDHEQPATTVHGQLSQEEIHSYLERLEDHRAISDDDFATTLMDDLDALTDSEKTQLVEAIEDHVGTARAVSNGDLAIVELALSASIPVQWSSWPSGKLPSHVGTTTACGGDTDLLVRFTSISGAYSSPGNRKLYTNSVYVWGIMAIHRYSARAYDISPNNTVNLCIGVKGAAGWPFISSSLKGMFWLGLWMT